MKKTVSVLLFLVTFLYSCNNKKDETEIADNNIVCETDSLYGVYIPEDLEDCFVQLDKILDDSAKIRIRQRTDIEFCNEVNSDLGQWLRNSWGIRKESRIARYFAEKGLNNPDDISSVILVSYHRHLTDNEIRLEEQINNIRDTSSLAQIEKEK